MSLPSKLVRRLLYAVIILEVCMLPLVILHRTSTTSTTLGVQLIPTVTPISAFDRAVKERVDHLQRVNGIGKSIAVSNRDVCYKEAKYGGWMVTGHELRCYSRYVQGFALETDSAKVREHLAAWQTTSKLFGASTRLEPPSGPVACDWYAEGEFNTLSLLPPEKTGQTDGEVLHYTCQIPDQEKSPRITSGSSFSTKDYAAFNEPALDRTKPILWMQYEEEYYNERTGCKTVSSSCNTSSSGMRTRTIDKAAR